MKSEADHQTAIFQWVKLHVKRYPELAFCFSTLNGIRIPIGLARKAKAQGNLRGVSDMLLLWPNGTFNGLAIELKIKGNYPSKEQKEFISFLNKGNYYACVCYGYKETIETILKYLKNEL